MCREDNPVSDAAVLALQALQWVVSDEDRALRFLALTGLTPDDLRESLGDDRMLGAVIDFLAAHEPDLLAVADQLGVAPESLVAAGRSLAS